jgi:hypothetical protein
MQPWLLSMQLSMHNSKLLLRRRLLMPQVVLVFHPMSQHKLHFVADRLFHVHRNRR